MGIPAEKVILHLPLGVKRDVQTASIFCEEIGLAFPDDGFLDEMDTLFRKIDILETLQAYGNKKLTKEAIAEKFFKHVSPAESEWMKNLFDEVLQTLNPQLSFETLETLQGGEIAKSYWQLHDMQERRSLAMQPYPHLQLDNSLLTTKKGEKGADGKVHYPGNISGYTAAGNESAIHARMRSASYIYEQQKALLQSQNGNQLSAHIFVGHRTGAAGFNDIKY